MSSSKLSAVSIVVLSHNRKDALEKNLVNLLQLVQQHGCELIVVDNASTDGSTDVIRRASAGRGGIQVLLNDRNLGVAGGRNAGWRMATRDFLLNIDDDTLVTGNDILKMLGVLQERIDIGIVSPRISHAGTGAMQLDLGDGEYQLTSFHGACHMVRRSLLQEIGFNDEACTFGGEELDLSIRARAAGYDVIYTPCVTALHDNHPRKGREGSDRLVRWLYNFVRVHHKHFPLMSALPLSLRYLTTYLATGMRLRGPLFALPLLGSAWRGMRDGRRHHQRVPDAAVAFYCAPDRLPDIGNVPLSRKVVGKWRNRS